MRISSVMCEWDQAASRDRDRFCRLTESSRIEISLTFFIAALIPKQKPCFKDYLSLL